MVADVRLLDESELFRASRDSAGADVRAVTHWRRQRNGTGSLARRRNASCNTRPGSESTGAASVVRGLTVVPAPATLASMGTLRANTVFTPGTFPHHTYVQRSGPDLEKRLRDALDTPGQIVSISGPSKSGKTVLVEKVVGRDLLIDVTGAGVTSADQLWDRILDRLQAPSEIATATAHSESESTASEGSGGVAIPIASVTTRHEKSRESSVGTSATETRQRTGLQQVVVELARSDFVILIDDFHYMPRPVQEDVTRQLKDAVRQELRVCTASVLHRSDDIVRALPELRGRVAALDIEYWSSPDLRRIAEIGFAALSAELDRSVVDRFVREAAGSPQLMQVVCLQACFEVDLRERLPEPKSFFASDISAESVFERAATLTDFRSLVDVLDAGAKMRGRERKTYKFIKGLNGDVYRAVLMAIAADPPRLSFDYDEITKRVARICVG